MGKVTITEGLAEIKTINARLKKKREAILRYFARDAKLRDPLEQEGGTVEFIRRERQAIADLEERLVAIRSSIQRANATTVLQLGRVTRSITDWLNWRRDVSKESRDFLQTMANNISSVRQQAQKAGLALVEERDGRPGEVVVGVSEKTLAEEIEAMEALLGDLDGKLSLLNATVLIEI